MSDTRAVAMSLASWWRQRRHDARISREADAAADMEWGRRKAAILTDPIGRVLWGAMSRHHLSLNSRSPVYGWQVERTYILTIEDVLAALHGKGRDA
jgi:hypothetical protein